MLGQPRAGRLRLRRLRTRALCLEDQVRLRDRLAEFLGAGQGGKRSGEGGPQLVHATDRGRVLQLRFPSRSRIRRWAQAHRAAILHQLRVPEVSTRIGWPNTSPRRAYAAVHAPFVSTTQKRLPSGSARTTKSSPGSAGRKTVAPRPVNRLTSPS